MIDIVYQDSDGTKKRVRETLSDVSEPDAWKAHVKIQELIDAGQFRPRKEREKTQYNVPEKVPTLKEYSKDTFLPNYAEVNVRPATVAEYNRVLEKYIIPVLGDTPLDQIRFAQIEELKAKLFKGGSKERRSAKTVKNILGVLSRLMTYAEECEVIPSKPRFKMPKVEKPKFDYLDFDEADRFLEAAKYNPEWHGMFHLALHTGLRYGELCELRWSDVDLVKGQIVVSRSYNRGHVGPPKSGRSRVIPLSKETVKQLKRVKHLRGELVFSKPDGERHIHRRADVAIKRVCRKAGLRPIGCHVLRHTFASHLVMKGATIKAVQELLGHSSVEMTMRYAHLSPDVKRDTVDLLDEPYQNVRHMHGT